MNRLTRRSFLAAQLKLAFGGAGVIILKNPRSVYAYETNQTLNIALVGVSGRGSWFVQAIPQIGQNIAALCDVNERRAAPVFERFPQVPKFRDFRKMFDQLGRTLDAVVVAVPDHNHAVISNTAMCLGKHVYCEKPLTHDVWEAKVLRQNAAKYKVATQMGNQGTATHAFRRGVELIQTKALGDIREVYVWKDSGGSGERALPEGSQPPPEYLDWEVWLGPAAFRPFHERWLDWHTWRDFATGNLGNWGSHSANMAFMGLEVNKLWDPTANKGQRIRVVAEVQDKAVLGFPRWEIVRWTIPPRGDWPSLKIEWFNGTGAPGRRQHVESLMGKKLDWGDAGRQKWDDHAGCLICGNKQLLHATGHNSSFTLLPSGRTSDEEGPPQMLPRSGSHEREWVAACRGETVAMSHFGYSGPLTEFLMLGNVATLFPEVELEFDPIETRIVNHPEADGEIKRVYRKGWELTV
ncbi:MAG: Gfo/Idh/MocA family protein [Thermogutta sp.]